MDNLKITLGEGTREVEVLASGVLRVQHGHPPVTFNFDGVSAAVRFYLIERPRNFDGTPIGKLEADEITPGYDGFLSLGTATVNLQLEAAPPLHKHDTRLPFYLLTYQVTRPVLPALAKAA